MVYIATIYSPCPEGRFIHSEDKLQKWCLAKGSDGIEKMHGPWVSIFPHGGMRERGEFNYGKKQEHWVTWYTNGRKKTEGNFSNGKPIGRWSNWDVEGKKTSQDYKRPKK